MMVMVMRVSGMNAADPARRRFIERLCLLRQPRGATGTGEGFY